MRLSEQEIAPYDEAGIERFGHDGWAVARRLLLADARWAKELPLERMLALLTTETLQLLGPLLDAGFACDPVHADAGEQVCWARRDDVALLVLGGSTPRVGTPRAPEPLDTVWTRLAAGGVGVPRLPAPFRQRGRWVGDSPQRWTTLPDDVDQPDSLEDYLMQDTSYLLGPVPDHLTTTLDARGFTLRAAVGPLAVHAQVAYGGLPDPAVSAGGTTALLHRVATLLHAAGESRWDESPRGRDVVLHWSEARNIADLRTWNISLRHWEEVPLNLGQHDHLVDQTAALLRRG